MNTSLVVYNTLSRKKEEFKPINPPYVGMYVCGPTVYSNVHLGNCRTFISFDLIFRYLQHLGYKVRYVRNITDAGHLENDADEGEDKIAKKARLEQLEPMEIVQRYTVDFRNVMANFNALPPSIEPTATGHIVEQIQMIQEILDKGLAYEVNGSVYFDVRKYSESENYGELSGRNIDELFEGTRDLDGQSEKRDARDFALWKNASPMHIMRWPSPWGVGFPGWHLECSVMSSKYLGNQFDIHGGGMDLKFPHHECEIAQCKAANEVAPVNYWLHTNMLTLNGKRMSKSTGNTVLPNELFSGENNVLEKGYHPMVVRFFMMQAHYRSPLDFSSEALNSAEKGFNRLMQALENLQTVKASSESTFNVADFVEKCYAAMNDDFNSPLLVAQLFEGVKNINALAAGKAQLTEQDLAEFKAKINAFVFDVLGLATTAESASISDSNGDETLLNDVVNYLLQMRLDAKKARDFATSDRIRNELTALGITIKDTKEGFEWTR